METKHRLLILILLDTEGGKKCNNTKGGRFDRRVIDGSLGIYHVFHFHDINRRSRVARNRPVSTKGKVYIAYTGLYILVPH